MLTTVPQGMFGGFQVVILISYGTEQQQTNKKITATTTKKRILSTSTSKREQGVHCNSKTVKYFDK